MPDLEPITREEMLLDGQDLEPITRKEMFIKRIYDKTQVIPETITREEMFLKKAGDETTDVTIEQLSVSENGTYSEEGVAYSPVIVNVPQPTLTTLDVTENGTYTAPSGTAYDEVEVDVPLPDNAYLLKEVEDLPKDIVTFDDGADLPMPSLKVGIEPIQEGSGEPSPTNVRPISGWDEAVVTVADDAESPTTSHEYTIDLDGTRYGGTVDLISGVLTVTHGYVDLGTLNWVASSDGRSRFYATVPSPYYKMTTDAKFICSQYIDDGIGSSTREYFGDNGTVRHNYTSNPSPSAYEIYIHDDRFGTDATAFKQAMNGVQLVYELATPLNIQLTPTAVKSLLGSNNVWGSTGQITEGSYFSKNEEE